jgi:hypothetical protein
MKSILKSTGPMSLAVLFALALAAATPLKAKKKDYLDGKILDAAYAKTDRSERTMTADGGPGTMSREFKHFHITVQVEDMTYVGDYKQGGGLLGIGHYKFKEEDWPVNTDVEVRLKVKHVLGLRHTYMYLKRSNGKEIELDVVSKTDSNGKELCGNYRC